MLENIYAIDKNTLFLWLAQLGHTSSLKKLLDLDEFTVDINMTSKNGNTALIIACDQNNIDCVKLLLEYGIDVNKLNNNGHSSLYIASKYNYNECIKLLLEYGANIDQLIISL